MTRGAASGAIDSREHYPARLAPLRVVLAAAYLIAEALFSASGLTATTGLVAGLFILYSVVLLAYHLFRHGSKFELGALFVDLIFLLALVFWSTGSVSAGVAASFYVFLVLESWANQGGREVILLATALSLVVYGARITMGRVAPLVVTVHSVLFLLVTGGTLAFLFSGRRYRLERRIAGMAHRATGAREFATVMALEEGLKELAGWFRCSYALLAFWDERGEHFCLCRYPPPQDAGRPDSTSQLEDSREWSVFRGERLDFIANKIETPPERGVPPSAHQPSYDLHPHLIRKFQIYSAAGCGLYDGDRAIGRLLLVNRVSNFRGHHLKRLQRLSPAFADFVRQILVIKSIEQAAADRERRRLAQDFHDGPLQSVISFQMRCHLIRRLMDRDTGAATRELDQLQDLARKQVTEMRTFVNSMRPVEVDTASLTAAARRLVEDFQKESGVPVTFISGEEPVSTPDKIGVDILQLIREALNNIQKHAQATHVLFSLEENDSHILIGVNDNGKGFRFGGKYSLDELETLRLGPNSIKQRMRALGGDLLLESQPGHGTSLRLKIPVY